MMQSVGAETSSYRRIGGIWTNVVISSISCCSNATGPIANTAKSTFSNTTMIMITITTAIAVQRSPNTMQ